MTAAVLAAATLVVAASPAASAPPARMLAGVATLAPAPVRCYPTNASYFADSGIAPTRYWLGIAGFWGVPQSAAASESAAPLIGLTANTCAGVSHLHDGVTLARAYATFTLSHEIAHALGAADEATADCNGAASITRVAQSLGLRGDAAYASLIRLARKSAGYQPIPASCWPTR